jgi:hypothetical protein
MVMALVTNFLFHLFFSKVSFDEQDCVLGVHGDVGYLLGSILSQLGGCLYYLLDWEGGSSLLDLFPSKFCMAIRLYYLMNLSLTCKSYIRIV